MDNCVVIMSPSADKQLWDILHDRVDDILHHRKLNLSTIDQCGVVVEEEEDSCQQLLMRGFDSLSSSLLHLSTTLSAAQQEVSDLAKPCLAKVRHRESEKTEDEPKPKRPRGFDKLDSDETEKLQASASPVQEDKTVSSPVLQSGTLKKAKNLATSMATKATFLVRELQSMKAELCFMQERCNLLEEENRRLREGFEKGVRPEEDDLVRLQLEALLAEKSRLANENANLTRENQCLHQLVEYHQLTALDLSVSYDPLIHGTCLDFSSPLGKADTEFDKNDNINDEKETPCTPSNSKDE